MVWYYGMVWYVPGVYFMGQLGRVGGGPLDGVANLHVQIEQNVCLKGLSLTRNVLFYRGASCN